MRFKSGEEFREWPAKAVTIFGMSGVGKTTLAGLLQRSGWFHYSVDYRIGTRYMGEHIIDNFKREAMKVQFLRDLLLSDSIYICSNITFENLSPLSTYTGKPGNTALKGIPFAEYQRRQEQHREAEIRALLDVPEFIQRARDIYRYEHFICDTGGSLCEVADPSDASDPVLRCLSDTSLLLYIEGSEQHTKMLVDRFRDDPKPMYYRPKFLDEKWAEYKSIYGIIGDNDVPPDDFAAWGFEQLLHHRLPIYEAIARNHGYRVHMEELRGIRAQTPQQAEEDFVALVSRAIDLQ
ncbi:MAG: ATPase [Proteobacteria bacterium]|nr:ATPase [Pseudomonadota bacterium]MBI3499389.1 ATPase [Pseudomonadota bacterium]